MEIILTGKTGIKYKFGYENFAYWDYIPVIFVEQKFLGIKYWSKLPRYANSWRNRTEVKFNYKIKNRDYFEKWFNPVIKNLESNLRKPELL